MKVAIDLGTTVSIVTVVGRGVVLREPSALAVRREGGRVIAYGDEAREMLGRAPASIDVIRPLRDGVIADFEAARQLLRRYLDVARPARWSPQRSHVVVCVPHGATPVEMESLRREVLSAGARRVDLVKEPFAAALGAGLPIDEPRGNLVVDIGGGTSEATAISLLSIVHCESLRTAGNAMDEAIEQHFRQEHQFAIGERTAERVKIAHGSVHPVERNRSFEVKGLDVQTRRPAARSASTDEIRESLEPIARKITEAVRRCIEHFSPELAGDVLGDGAVIVGGGALLGGWCERLRDQLGLKARIGDDPLMAVTRGLIRILEERERFADLVANSRYTPTFD